jgi:hypothetical protein
MAHPEEKCGPTIIRPLNHTTPSKQASDESLLLISPLPKTPIHTTILEDGALTCLSRVAAVECSLVLDPAGHEEGDVMGDMV